jgi:hypothetical protein
MRALIAAVACVGCTALVGTGRPEAPAGVRAVEGRLEGERYLLADARRAREAGASEQQVVAVDAGAPGDRISGFLSVPGDACALVMARGSAQVDDIDLFAFGEDGTMLGADERASKTPIFLICPPHPERVYLSARVSSGFGLVAVGAQTVTPKASAAVGAALAVPGYGTHAAGEGFAEVDRALALHRRGIGGRWQELRRAALPVEPGTPSLISAVIEPNRCLDAWVTPTEAVSHLDVSLIDAEGRIAGRAVAHGRSRFLVACAAEKTPVSLEVRPQSGRGVAVVVLSQSKDGGRGELGARIPVVDLGAMLPLDEALATLAERLDKGDYDAPKPVLRAELPVAQRSSVDLTLRAGCTRFDAVGGRPLSGIEAWLWAGDTALVAHDRGPNQVTLFSCSAGGPARLDLEALARSGPVVVEQRRFRKVADVLTQHPLAASRLLGRVLTRGTVRRVDQLGLPKLAALSETKRVDLDLLIPIARCADVVLALGPGAAGAEVRIVDKATGKEVDRGLGRHHAAARGCALDRRGSLQARAELTVTSGSTDALVLTRQISPAE